MERCRTEMLRAKGLEQDYLINDLDLIFAVRRVEADYISPAKFNDQLLVTAKIIESSKVRVQFEQSIYRYDGSSLSPSRELPNELSAEFVDDENLQNKNTLLCNAKISIVSLSASQLRPKRIPESTYQCLLNQKGFH